MYIYKGYNKQCAIINKRFQYLQIWLHKGISRNNPNGYKGILYIPTSHVVNNLVGYRIMCCNFVFQILKSSFILCVCTCVCKCVGMFVNVYGAQRLMLGAFTLNRKTPNEAKLTEHQAPGVTQSLPSTCCHARNSTWTRSV